jgi:hypothetical protein
MSDIATEQRKCNKYRSTAMNNSKWVALAGMTLAACLSVWSRFAHADNLADLGQFVDKSTPAPKRQELFTAWRQAALAGDIDAQYVVGTILKRGDNIEPHVAERDADQARRYLSTAAGHGRVLAMAKMAELELAEDRPLEASIWAQVFGYYRGWVGNANPGDFGEHDEREPSIYFEDLLRRVSDRMRQKLGDQQTDAVLAQLNAFVAAHDKDVRAGLWRDGIAPPWSGPRLKFENAKSMRRVNVAGARNMISEWVLVFAADGSAKSAAAFDAIPNFTLANGHHSLVMQYAAGAGADERRALKTVDLRKADWTSGPVRTR